MYGTTLQQLRSVFGYSAKDMSKELKISASYLSEIENDKKQPSLTLLQNYASILGLKLSTLVLLTEKEEQLQKEGKGKIIIRQIMLKTLAKYAGDVDDQNN